MGELNYMKQLVRELFDIHATDLEGLSYDELNIIRKRQKELREELKELSGYED